MKREPGELPPMCDQNDDPDAAWNVLMKACITPYSKSKLAFLVCLKIIT
jgi:hypothetical protein